MENLRKEIETLQNENMLLKNSIKDLAAVALKTSAVLPITSNAADPILLAVKEIITMMELSANGSTTENTYQRSFCISNAMVQGNPVLYQSQEYPKMKLHQQQQMLDQLQQQRGSDCLSGSTTTEV